MRALSVRQPWAWLIAQSYKDIENRVWPTRYTGPFLIHAGKTMEKDMKYVESVFRYEGITLPDHFDRGGFVGVARITGCVTSSVSHWFGGPYGFLISDARPIPFHPYRGKLSLWEVSDFTPPELTMDFQPLAQMTTAPVVKDNKRKSFLARLFGNS